jgi:Undecaprenyl-phosphate galactose phosphotransferase WbaP
LKRILDLVVSIVLIVLLTPLLILIAALLKVTEKGPVLFQQIRVGKNGKHFQCLKFRTMVVNAEEALQTYLSECPDARREWIEGQKLRNDPRVTALGRFLRKSSLDELPQLFNVLAGHMSLVGPRPITDGEIPRYGDKILAYMAMRPGLTGLWQISGRSNCTYEERVRLDARYVSEWKLRTDIMILLRTVPALLRQDGSY